MATCADTRFLYSLYGNDVNTARAVACLQATRAVLTLTILKEYGLGNALRFAECRGALRPGGAALFWAQFEADRASGRLRVQICNLAEVVGVAQRLLATHTVTAGHRDFDILHVAAALHVKADHLLTFDGNQRKLAGVEGLRTPM